MISVHRSSPRASALVALVGVLVVGVVTVSGCSMTSSAAGGGDADTLDRAGRPTVTIESQTDSGSDTVRTVDAPSTVAVVGDSITVASAEHLEPALTGLGLEVVAIEAQVGRRMTVGERDRLYTGADIVELVANQQSPELWVIALGTNDIGQYADQDEVAEQIRTLLARLPGDAPVVWVDTWFRGREEQTEVVNAAIRSVLGARPDSHVVEWSAHATDDGVLSGDGVHLTDGVGRQRFADVVSAGVETFLDAHD